MSFGGDKSYSYHSRFLIYAMEIIAVTPLSQGHWGRNELMLRERLAWRWHSGAQLPRYSERPWLSMSLTPEPYLKVMLLPAPCVLSCSWNALLQGTQEVDTTKCGVNTSRSHLQDRVLSAVAGRVPRT